MDQNQQYLIEVLARKVTLELLNPLQNRIINLQQDYTNIDQAISKHTQAISIINQQQQQRQLQDSIQLKNMNELHTTIASLEEKQILAIQTQNQTFTNLMDRIEHYSQQLNDRSEKLKELQQQYQQLKGDQNFVHQTYITNIDNIQKRVNQLISTQREETEGNRFSADKIDSKMQDLIEKLNKIQEKTDQYQQTYLQQNGLNNQVNELVEQFERIKEQTILKEEYEKSIKQQSDHFKCELNTIQFKYQQILSQNNRNITQMQQQIDSFQYQREDTQRQFSNFQGQLNDLRIEFENKNSEILKSINNQKVLFEQRYEEWSETFHSVQKVVEQFKFDFTSMKQNYKKTILKYDEVFEQYKEKCDNDIMQILNRNTNIQKQYLDEQIQIMDNHFIEELQSLQNQLIPNIIQNITSLDNEGKQNQQIQKKSKLDIDDNQSKQYILQVPSNQTNINPHRKSKVQKDTVEAESPLGINITSIHVSGNNKSIRSNSRMDGYIEYQSFEKKQSVSKGIDNLELIEIKQQLEKLLESQKSCQFQYQQQDKDLKQLNDKVKKHHERLEFFFLQTKTQLNKYNSKIDTIQNDTKIGQPQPDREFVDLNYIKRELEQLQGQITKIKSDIQNDATFTHQQIKNLQKIRDQILPKQQEQQIKMDQLDECQKLMIILLLQNELVQISHEDGLYRVDQNVNNLHFEFQPGLKDENTHITYRQQRISKVDFILNQILSIKKITLSTSRIDLNLSQSQTLRKQQTNRNLNKNGKISNSVIVAKNQKLNESTRLTMRNTFTVEMSQKYMNRSQRQRDTFYQAKISLSNQRLNQTLTD
ncbi:unnamed protein product [Paramecium sonneborni]|uniref:Uncharacterized protein n=1 Tax=Paramecium sonneborni TaxID=65129 RepID=A0A8S1MMF0_9CILI|nr:unnamed protein product [Paramecium sonneborni]